MFKTIATKNFSYPLQKDMYYTKGARFTADKRLRYKARLSNFCVAALSLYIIAISIGLLAYDGVLAGPLAKKLNALTIILSVAAFGYSLVMSASGYEVKASEMHACGMAINKLLKNLDATMSAGPVSPMFLQDIEGKYNLALEKCPNNHETIDYLRFKAECAHEIYGGNFFAIEFLSWRYSTGYYIDILLHICPMVLLATVPWIFIN